MLSASVPRQTQPVEYDMAGAATEPDAIGLREFVVQLCMM